MADKEVANFYGELREEIIEKSKQENRNPAEIFKEIFVSYLAEAGETNVADCNFLNFKKEAANMRLDGYSYSEYFNSLNLIVCKYDSKSTMSKIGKTEIDKYIQKARNFYRRCNDGYFDDVEPSSDVYEAYKYVESHKDEIETVNIVFLTNDETVQYIPDDKEQGKVTFKYFVWDIDALNQILFKKGDVEKKLVIRLKKKYNTSLPLIKVQSENDFYDCYIGVLSGQLLADIYEDEGQKLIQKNVRSFLQATGKVNKGIKQSLATEPEMFMAYNNGISTIAEDIVIDEERSTDNYVTITELTGWQIVNGGQTTASIYNASQNKQSLENVNVQIKISVIKNKDKAETIIRNISKYANSQNKINMSDFNANDEYHIQMEKLSRSLYIPVKKGKGTEQWFYERARGQYYTEMHRYTTPAQQKDFKARCPKNRCISKTVAAKCMMSYRGFPYLVSKGLETNFVFFSDMVAKGEFPAPSEQSYYDMIAKVILFNQCDAIVKSLNFGGYKAQTNYYVMALLGTYFSDRINTLDIWKNQTADDEVLFLINELAEFVFNEHFLKPVTVGVNITQWCKREECWELLKERFKNSSLYNEGNN